jgi:hypothetical protein
MSSPILDINSEPPRIYRQRTPDPTRPFVFVAVAAVATALAGILLFGRSGGLGATVLSFVPLVTVGVAAIAGRRFPLRRIWRPAVIVTIDHQRLGWSIGGQWQATEWVRIDEIARDFPSLPSTAMRLVGSDGRILARLPDQLVRVDAGTRARLGQVALRTRPDLFIPQRTSWRRQRIVRDPDSRLIEVGQAV